MTSRQALGVRGEEIAASFLADSGMTIVARNWRHPLGEVDIVAVEPGYWVIVEVKTRTGRGAGDPLEALTPTKVRRLRRLSAAWEQKQHTGQRKCRIDAVGVTFDFWGHPHIEHVKGIGES